MGTYRAITRLHDPNPVTRLRATTEALPETGATHRDHYTRDDLLFLIEQGAFPTFEAIRFDLAGDTDEQRREQHAHLSSVSLSLARWYDEEPAWTHVDWRALSRFPVPVRREHVLSLVDFGLWYPAGGLDLDYLRPNLWQWVQRAALAQARNADADVSAWTDELTGVVG